MTQRPLWPGLLLGFLIPGMIYAATAVVPNRFQAGGLIRADEMNANFDSLRDAINAGESGTRLRVLRVVGSDGLNTVLPTGSGLLLWDSQLSITCVPGFGRCVPLFVATSFSDSGCQQRVAPIAGQNGLSYYATAYGFDAGMTEANTFAYALDANRQITFYRLGTRQTGPIYYAQQGSGGVMNCVAQGSSDYAPTTAVEPATTFAPVTISVN